MLVKRYIDLQGSIEENVIPITIRNQARRENNPNDDEDSRSQ